MNTGSYSTRSRQRYARFMGLISGVLLLTAGVLAIMLLVRAGVSQISALAPSEASQELIQLAQLKAIDEEATPSGEEEAQGETSALLGPSHQLPLPTTLGSLEEQSAKPAPVSSDDRSQGAWFTIGSSIQGRPIQAMQLGSGPVRLALMGGIHGGWERNTERLVHTMYEHFRDRPREIPERLTIYFLQTTNPDGLAAGSGRESAWNARGVDLNRNFDTPNWSPHTYGRVGGRYGSTGTRQGAGGTAPFSEPETRAIRDFIFRHSIAAVISYHSGIESVTARDGGGGIAEPLARRIAQITGYRYVATWTEYPLTGQFMDWLDMVGVRGIEIDLPNQQSIDWDKNLAAIRAVIAALASG